jgi:hypothetical protein
MILGAGLLVSLAASTGAAPDLMVVDMSAVGVTLARKFAIQVCAGLFNREEAVASGAFGAAYTLGFNKGSDAEWLADIEGVTDPPLMGADDFLARCLVGPGAVAKGGWLRFNASDKALVPITVTVAGVLDAVPLEDGDAAIPSGVAPAFDAVAAFAGMAELRATEYVFERWANRTTTMAKMNPGYDVHGKHKLNPPLTGTADPGLVDFIVAKRLFNFWLPNGCLPLPGDLGKEHALMERMATSGAWPTPITVYGYDDTFAFAGDLYEAETGCVAAHNMGQVASNGFNNLGFWARHGPLTAPQKQVPTPPHAPYNASKTYMAFVMGDGDNLNFIKGSRRGWMQERVANCAGTGTRAGCFPLLWSISPNLLRSAPGMLRWFYNQSYATGADWFVGPPSGDLYAYPSLMPAADQARFVAATEKDAVLMDTSATVSWEPATAWGKAIRDFYPRYAAANVVQGLFAVNVPYMVPIPAFGLAEHYKVLDGKTVLFRPKEWRGGRGGDAQDKNATDMAAEINGYAKGSVGHLYITSDGGANLELIYDMVGLLDEHVEIVNHRALTALALEAKGYALTK